LFFLSSAAIAAGPLVAVVLAAVVDLTVTSLFAGVKSIWEVGWVLVAFWDMGVMCGGGWLSVRGI
jgi:hypothetical protein